MAKQVGLLKKLLSIFVVILIIVLLYLILKYDSLKKLLASNPELGSFIWSVMLLIFCIIIVLISKRKFDFAYKETILGGIIGGVFAGFILELKNHGEYQGVIAFLMFMLVIALLWKKK